MTSEEYLTQWLKYHRGYERRAYNIFRKSLIATVNRVPINNLTYQNYKQLIELNILLTDVEAAYIEVYRTIGLIHGNRVGMGINRELKDYSKPLFNEEFQRTIIDWVRSNCGLRIRSVARTLAEKIIALVEDALGENLSIEQMQKFVRDKIGRNVLSRYEVLRIARTEVTSSANHASTVSGETSKIVLVKRWISTLDGRTRRKPEDNWSHLAMNGKEVGQFEKFHMVSKKGEVNDIDYPCAPGSSAENCIMCRCSIALVPKRDADGFVVRR